MVGIPVSNRDGPFSGAMLVSGRVTLGKLEVLKFLELSPASPVVEDLLDASGRERLLIGPTTGLVTCPDFDVRCDHMEIILIFWEENIYGL